MSNINRIAVSVGEPAGIGPDLICLLSQRADLIPVNCELVLFADRNLLQQRAECLGIRLNLVDYEPDTAKISQLGQFSCQHIPLEKAVDPGILKTDNANYVIECLTQATQSCLSKQLDALVTGPIHKGVINESGMKFSGHTEYLAEQANVDQVVMMLATEGLRVALATTHLPLKDVASAIQSETLTNTIKILHHDLQRHWGIQNPHIIVAGLNPHAGENGHMGREEIDIIIPVLEALRAQGMTLEGPLPADTLFTPQYLERADAVLAMYHDQGLPVLKYKGFGAAVNITLGLPFIRTSVDHGTALDLAGSGNCDLGSLLTALDYANTMINARQTEILPS